ncbi:hypothetical protein O0I10_012282 [Lichtheimia ornata]|uniref:PiggyBac transposable element-derived protein domain-containing protein n=1 Tax=Lichtheimia ornata TaxID=688661 RepID=A0AAD7UTA7_9FUNG|nr:uncharacterized protein O0I10_012282 [Lichtheimia ornata]KAJ8652095.1 hypothetical protein O0I10_012282 [Lichtheimia ornata]
MVKILSKFTVGIRVSFLPRAFATRELAETYHTTKASKERLYGMITAVEFATDGTKMAVIDVEGFAELPVRIKLGSLKDESATTATTTPMEDIQGQPETTEIEGLVDYESDSSSESDADDNDDSVDNNEDEEHVDQWRDDEIVIDRRFIDLGYMQQPQLTLHDIASKTPLDMFKHFLPMDYIGEHVIHAINANAAAMSIQYWKTLTIDEYLLWIGLWTAMVLIPLSDRAEYWSTTPTFLRMSPLNFGRWMPKRRFDSILQAHTLEHPDVISSSRDPLVAIRAFVDAYNDNLVTAMIPGRTMTIDESMNQWLGKVSRMPNVKKIIGKPHPVGQEFKNIADASTNIMLRLDISEKKQEGKKFSNLGLVPGCMLRLTEPWFATGRTIVADSWFGSPASVAALRKKGLYSILALKKRKYWPRNVPSDIIDNLPSIYGSHVCKVKTIDDVPMFVAALRDRKPQCLISTCSTTLPGSVVSHIVKDNNQSRRVTFQRPVVFDEYHAAKGAIDINNNIRDNMASYHDVIRSQSWQHRSFAFFLAVAEANAFLAWRAFGSENLRGITHYKFRERLASELVNGYAPYNPRSNVTARGHTHKIVGVGHK